MTWSKWRIGKLREKRIINTGALRFTRLGTANGDEGRAEAIRAAIIFVAARLIDRPLAPEGGFLRDDADAARLNGAIAACFTNLLCDEDAFGRIRKSTALAPPPFRSEEHTSELQSLMRISYAVFCLKK